MNKCYSSILITDYFFQLYRNLVRSEVNYTYIFTLIDQQFFHPNFKNLKKNNREINLNGVTNFPIVTANIRMEEWGATGNGDQRFPLH